jgi:hypothetical protein
LPRNTLPGPCLHSEFATISAAPRHHHAIGRGAPAAQRRDCSAGRRGSCAAPTAVMLALNIWSDTRPRPLVQRIHNRDEELCCLTLVAPPTSSQMPASFPPLWRMTERCAAPRRTAHFVSSNRALSGYSMPPEFASSNKPAACSRSHRHSAEREWTWNSFPYLLKICASTLGLCAAPLAPGRRRHRSVQGPINLGARRSISTPQRRCRDLSAWRSCLST